MKKEEYFIEKECVLRDWLKSRFSSRRILSLKRAGGIFVNGACARADLRLKAGDRLELEFVEEKQNDKFLPEDLGLEILYEDENYTVIRKGRGVTSMPTVRHPQNSVLNGMKFLRPNGFYRVATRLDKDTEGLVLLANDALSMSRLEVTEKLYVAILDGKVEKEITVDTPIMRGEGIKRVVGGDKRCVSVIRPVMSGKYTLAVMQPITGRTHQLRVHAAHVGLPILGDTLYGGGSGEYNGGQYLACYSITFGAKNGESKRVECADIYNKYADVFRELNGGN